jgi:hypothetical protein
MTGDADMQSFSLAVCCSTVLLLRVYMRCAPAACGVHALRAGRVEHGACARPNGVRPCCWRWTLARRALASSTTTTTTPTKNKPRPVFFFALSAFADLVGASMIPIQHSANSRCDLLWAYSLWR